MLFAIFAVVGSANAQSADTSAGAVSKVEVATPDFDPDLDAWVWSVGLEVGAMGYRPKASMNGSPLDPDAVRAPNLSASGDGPGTVISADSDRSSVVSALVGANFEVMLPRFFESPLVPRLFFDLNVSAVLTSELAIVRNGKPEPNRFAVPDERGINPIGETLVLGIGEEVTAQEQGPAVYFGIGGAFTFDLDGGSRLRVKPSLVYSRTRVEISGIAARAVREAPFTSVFDNKLDAFRFIVLREDFSEVYHGIGPAIELELDTNNRLGPFEISIFLKGHANHIFGDLDTDLFQANSPDNPVESVRWRYEQERWTYRASTGIRFRLVGSR